MPVCRERQGKGCNIRKAEGGGRRKPLPPPPRGRVRHATIVFVDKKTLAVRKEGSRCPSVRPSVRPRGRKKNLTKISFCDYELCLPGPSVGTQPATATDRPDVVPLISSRTHGEWIAPQRGESYRGDVPQTSRSLLPYMTSALREGFDRREADSPRTPTHCMRALTVWRPCRLSRLH